MIHRALLGVLIGFGVVFWLFICAVVGTLGMWAFLKIQHWALNNLVNKNNDD